MKRSRFNKFSQRDIPRLKRKLWKLFSLYVRQRDNYVCFTCGGRFFIQAGHFISRTNNATLFDERNVHAQDAFCNLTMHGNVGVYAQKLIEKYGKEEFDNLVALGKTVKQWTVNELLELIAKYESAIMKK